MWLPFTPNIVDERRAPLTVNEGSRRAEPAQLTKTEAGRSRAEQRVRSPESVYGVACCGADHVESEALPKKRDCQTEKNLEKDTTFATFVVFRVAYFVFGFGCFADFFRLLPAAKLEIVADSAKQIQRYKDTRYICRCEFRADKQQVGVNSELWSEVGRRYRYKWQADRHRANPRRDTLFILSWIKYI